MLFLILRIKIWYSGKILLLKRYWRGLKEAYEKSPLGEQNRKSLNLLIRTTSVEVLESKIITAMKGRMKDDGHFFVEEFWEHHEKFANVEIDGFVIKYRDNFKKWWGT